MWLLYQQWFYACIVFVIKAIWQSGSIFESESNREDLGQCLENTRCCFCELQKS